MKLSTIIILTICQFLIEAAKLVPLESRDSSMQTNCAGLSQVTNVQIFQMVNQLVVVWQPPACDIENVHVKYIVEYTGRTIEIETIETEETFHYFDYTPNICFDVEFTITAVMDGVRGAPYNTIYQSRSSQVTHVQTFEMMGQLVVVWRPPDCDTGDAQLKYIVMYTAANVTETIETDETFHYFDNRGNICFDSEISITAVINKMPGAPHNTVHNTGLIEVANIYAKHSLNNIVHIQWEAPECDLDYLITLATSNGITNITVVNKFYVDIENIFMKPCENATVTITPMRGEISGPTLKRNIQGAIGPVRNIAIEHAFDGEDIIVDFQEPENTDLCDLRYEIHTGDPGCLQRNISISVFNTLGDVNNTTLLTVRDELELSVKNLKAVRVLGSNRVDVTFDALDIVRDCNGRYHLRRLSDEINTIGITTTDTFWGFFSCDRLNVTVAPIVNNVIGPTSIYSLPAC